MMAKAIKVEKRMAEKIRKKLIQNGLLIQNLKIRRNGKYVYFPIIKKCDYGDFIEKMEFEEKKKNYIELAKEEGIEIDSISIDFIGDIALIRLPENLKKFKKKIGEILLKTNKHIKSVYIDKGVKNEYRIREIEFIKGEGKTETIHNEYGIKIKIDVSKVYFSPRLAGERMRVAKQIKKENIVIDMFAGVAPFSLLIAKYAHPKKIYAIDKNPYAIKYAKINAEMNGVDNIIEIIGGDAKEIIKKLPHANHVIMNLPHKSFEFLPYAIEKGDIIHYYEIIERGKEMKRKREITSIGKKLGYKISIKNMHVVGSYSPSKNKIGMDLFIKQF